MKLYEFTDALREHGLVAVVRGSTMEEAEKTAEAVASGGVALIEITFTVPDADKLIARVKEKLSGKGVIVGAGTVMNVKTAELALAAGAEFVVSPHLDEELLRFVLGRGVAYAPGIFTPTEYARAISAGADAVKLFPGDVARPAGLKALRGPFPHAKVMPTGGVTYDNLVEWFMAGAIAVGAGGSLTRAAKTGDFNAVAEDAAAWIERIKGIERK